MTTRVRWCSVVFLAAFMDVSTSADQTAQLTNVMRDERYRDFVKYGDAHGYQRRLPELRRGLKKTR